MTDFVGRIATFAEHHVHCPDAVGMPAPAVRLWPRTEHIEDALVSGTVDDVLLTSCFVPIDLGRSLMYLDQSYSGLAGIIPLRFKVEGYTYRLSCDPLPASGRHVVIGGPIDTVWYHWLFNWCPRLLLLKMLRPDLLAAPDVRIVVHPLAMKQPYRAILDTFGLHEDRFLVIDPDQDYRLEQATLVSFLDQDKLYPTIIRAFADHLVTAFDLGDCASASGVFASRQELPPPKRRISNFAEIEPVLTSFGVAAVSCGKLEAAEQARIFREAQIVVGGHGSDLSNILFCRPGTPVIVIENQFSVHHDRHVGLLKLAEVLQLDYHLLVSATTDDPGHGLTIAQHIARDYVVDPCALKAMLEHVVEAATRSKPTASLEAAAKDGFLRRCKRILS